MHGSEIVPQSFQPERSVEVAGLPQERHHFPKGSHTRMLTPRACYDTADHSDKTLRIRRAVDHELRQRLGRIQEDILLLGTRSRDIHPLHAEACVKLISMRRGGNHDGSFSGCEPFTCEMAQSIEQVRLLLINL
jgi:hypothetical protein